MKPFLIIVCLSACLTACTTADEFFVSDTKLLGAWAGGTESNACVTEQITYFSADGVVIDMYQADGEFHSFGRWRREADTLIITHNELPLVATGQSNPEIKLTLVTINANRLDVRNRKGEIRERVKCPNTILKAGS